MSKTKLRRRDVLKAGMVAGGSAILGPYLFSRTARAAGFTPQEEALVRAVEPRTPLSRFKSFRPFTEALPIPPVLKSVPSLAGGVQCPLDPAWGRPKFYQITAQRGVAQIVRGVNTEVFTYNGRSPGPTVKATHGTPAVIRFINALEDTLISTHLHGSFTPAISDGFPNNFILPTAISQVPPELLIGECDVAAEPPFDTKELLRDTPLGVHEIFKDYCYPNKAPGGNVNDNPSTMWYHDHALDITGVNVYQGLAGFYLFSDAVERDLIRSGRLPADQFDIPLVIQDKTLDADGQLFFDCLNHDGFLGDLFVVNGKLQPVLRVQRRKYRFRLLNGATARHFELEFTPADRVPVLQIGSDSWLLPKALRRGSMLLAPAERHDVIVDFTNAPDEVFLNNILLQNDGRNPEGKRDERVTVRPGFPILKFVVGPATSKPPDATIKEGDALRTHIPIRPNEIVRTRTFEFERKGGVWVINAQQFDPLRNDTPGLRVGDVERWILKNGGGGWWHPIHIHLEHHEIQSIDGKRPPAHEDRIKKDTTALAGNTVAEVFIRFREFEGPYVWHCHNIMHEDLRMMKTLNPLLPGSTGLLTR